MIKLILVNPSELSASDPTYEDLIRDCPWLDEIYQRAIPHKLVIESPPSHLPAIELILAQNSSFKIFR